MKKFVTFLFLLFSFQFSSGQNMNPDIVSEIRVETTDNISVLTAKVFNKSDIYQSLRFVFSITTFDEDYKPLNKSLEEFLNSEEANTKTLEDFLKERDSKQFAYKDSVEDFFSLDPFQSKDLYQASISTGIENQIIVLLLIYNEDGNLIDKNRVIFNQEGQTKKEEKVTEENIRNTAEIAGIVVDQTKTRMGRDFYDKFYFYYNYNNVKGDQVVTIDEIYTFRRTTKIMVIVLDETLMEFFARPNEEYLEQMAKYTVQRVYEYFQNRKKQKSYISQY